MCCIPARQADGPSQCLLFHMWKRASSQHANPGSEGGYQTEKRKADLGLQVQPRSQARATAPVCS